MSFADEGPAVDSAIRERLFERFKRFADNYELQRDGIGSL
jgi:hypothetical protein